MPRSPVKVKVPETAAVRWPVPILVIWLKSAEDVVFSAVTATVPVSVMVMILPSTFAAVAVKTELPSTVVVNVPRSPVKVTLLETAAVWSPVLVIRLKLASALAFSAVTVTDPSPSINIPLTFKAVAVKVVSSATVVVNEPKLPMKVMLLETAAVLLPELVIPLKSAPAVIVVTATLPAPLMVLPVTTAASAVKVLVASTVVMSVPRLPVKVTLPETKAVLIAVVIRCKSASDVVSNAVTATAPSPVMALPSTTAAVAVKVLVVATVNELNKPRFPMKVMVSETAAVLVPELPIWLKSVVASSAVTATIPAPVIVLPETIAAVAVKIPELTVVVNPPRLPVNVKSPANSAVLAPPLLMLLKLALSVPFSAVTATLPAPVMILP